MAAAAPAPREQQNGGQADQQKSLRALAGSKIVKKLVGQPPPGAPPSTGSAARNVATAGSSPVLGDIMASYQTSTLPSELRTSISHAYTQYERLAAEAGIDPDAEDITMEDLRIRRPDDGLFPQDDDSDDEMDFDVSHNNVTSQKLAHKERSVFQMVDVLSSRLTNLNAIVIDRYNGCKSDLNEASTFRSSRTKKLLTPGVGKDEEGGTPRKGEKGKRVTIFSQLRGGGGGDGDKAHVVDPARLTFRSAPNTDAGRNLDSRFEEEYGLLQALSSAPKFKKVAAHKLKRLDHKKTESRKQERLFYERKLQSNLERYVTRAVAEVVYKVPDKASRAGDDPRDEDAAGEEPQHGGGGGGAGGGGATTEGAQHTALSKEMVLERFPIPVELNEMNPRLLLSYACERIVLPGGLRIFKHCVLLGDSQRLFVYMYWLMHCKFFQEESSAEQLHILHRVSLCYVRLLETEGMEEYKDFFFKHYPFLIANAISWGFYYLCPGSRHLYSSAFKRVLYLQCGRILGGVDLVPVAVTEIRAKLFPDEASEAVDDLDYMPPVISGGGGRGGGPGGPAPAMAAAAAAAAATTAGATTAPSTEAGEEGEVATGGGGGGVAALGAVAGTSSIGGGSSSSGRGAERVGTGGAGAAGRGGGGGGGARSSLPAAKDDGMMTLKMSRAYRPDPLAALMGDRRTLRFKPRKPEGLTSLRPRQQHTVFDAAQISPLLQDYLAGNSATAGRRSETIIRTVPVPWCCSGGQDTFRRHQPRKDVHDAIAQQHARAHAEYTRAKMQGLRDLRRALRRSDSDMEWVFRRGPRQVGLKSMDIVTELQQGSGLKGFKRPEVV